MHRGSPRQRITSDLTNLPDNSTCSVQSVAFQARSGSHLWFQAAGICSCFPFHDTPGHCPGGTTLPMGSTIFGAQLLSRTCSPPSQSLSLSLLPALGSCLGNLSLNGIIFLQAVLGGSPRQSYFCAASARVLHLSELQAGPLRVSIMLYSETD